MANVHKQPIALISICHDPAIEDGSALSYSSIRLLGEALAHLGWQVDLFTRKTSPQQSKIVQQVSGCRTIRLEAGPAQPLAPEQILNHLPQWISAFQSCQTKEGNYPLVHTFDWVSGEIGLQLKECYGIQLVHTQSQSAEQYKNCMPSAGSIAASKQPLIDQQLDQQADQLVSFFSSEKSTVYSNPNYSKLAAKVKLGFHPVTQVVLCADPLTESDLDMMLSIFKCCCESAKQLPDQLSYPMHLVLANENAAPERSQIEQLVQAYGLEQHVSVVSTKSSQLPLYYRAASVYVVPGAYVPFSSAALDAISYDIPVVAAETSGLRFTIVPEETGLLVSPNTSTAFAAAVHRILFDQLWATRWKRQPSGQHELVLEWTRSAAHLSDLYRRLLAQTICPSLSLPVKNPYLLQVPLTTTKAPAKEQGPIVVKVS